jgi:thiol:disulfide interchange protein DsbD
MKLNFSSALILFVALFLILYGQIARADESYKPERYVDVSIVPEFSEVEGGDTLYIAILQNIHPGWHTYWYNPGDSGEGTNIDWQLPPGFEAQPIEYPIPHKIPIGPLVNFGFEEEAVLLQQIYLPDTLPEGPITLKAELSLLVCKDICIPEFSSHEITLNNGENSDNSEIIMDALNHTPTITGWRGNYKIRDDKIILDVDVISRSLLKPLSQTSIAEFFPFQWGVTDYASPANILIDNEKILIEQKYGDRDLLELDQIDGILSFEDTTGAYSGYFFTFFPDPDWKSELLKSRQKESVALESQAVSHKNFIPDSLDQSAQNPLFMIFLFAFLGGMILNLMPCVFPILSMKALSFCKMREKEQNLVRKHGWAYTTGILISFLVLATLLTAIKTAGAQIGWGFQLQNAYTVLCLSWLLFLIGLNFSGFYSISMSFPSLGGKFLSQHSLFATFLTGVLAVIVATPCTVPFMGIAVSYALSKPAITTYSVFAAMGFGLAAPYLILSHFPLLQKILPKPGAWMERFKELLAFPLYFSAAWLVWVYDQQVGPSGVLIALSGAGCFVLALWLTKHTQQSPARKALTTTLVILLIFSPFYYGYKLEQFSPNPAQAEKTELSDFSLGNLSTHLAGDRPIFVNMTAAWCITCKLNEQVALSDKKVTRLFKEKEIIHLEGDWTNYDPEITSYLNEFKRSGVPLYVYYPKRDPDTNKRDKAIILPQILTPQIMYKTINGDPHE